MWGRAWGLRIEHKFTGKVFGSTLIELQLFIRVFVRSVIRLWTLMIGFQLGCECENEGFA